jgi:hypothetical protein
MRAAGLFLDDSKNRITDETLALLVRLARECGLREKIDAIHVPVLGLGGRPPSTPPWRRRVREDRRRLAVSIESRGPDRTCPRGQVGRCTKGQLLATRCRAYRAGMTGSSAAA